MTQRVFVDANVLFSKTLMDWLFHLRLANEGMFQIHTTEDVLAETIANMRKRRPGAPGSYTRQRLDAIREVFDEIIRDYPALDEPGSPRFSGTDKDDYHVHAGACAGEAHIILTCNTATDITTNPDAEPYEIVHPDDFFCLVAASNPSCLPHVVQKQIDHWASRPGRLQLDDRLRQANCTAFADEVRTTLRRMSCGGGHPFHRS